MVGLLTLVTRRVGSVTSTSFLVSFGDRRTNSAPMSQVSSGALPGHNCTTLGFSPAAAGPDTHTQGLTEADATIRFMVAPVFSVARGKAKLRALLAASHWLARFRGPPPSQSAAWSDCASTRPPPPPRSPSPGPHP